MNIRDYYETHIILECEQDVTDVGIICRSFGLNGATYCSSTKDYVECDVFIDGDWFGVWPKKEDRFRMVKTKKFIEDYYNTNE